MRPGVSLCLIVRDEEKNLEACLRPLRSLADEIIVVDTGSTDRSRQVAAQWGAKVYDFQWSDDFSAARNEALRHACGDWILWMDADDRIDGENLERLAALRGELDRRRGDIYLARVFSPMPSATSTGCWVTHPRLFRRGARLHWTRRVHEELTQHGTQSGLELCWTDLVIRHVGYQNPVRRRRKLHRDMRLLQMEFAVNPDDPLTLFYLGWGHLEMDHLPQAVRFLHRSMDRKPNFSKPYTLLAKALSRQNRKREALDTCDRGLIAFPDDPELLYSRGGLLGELGDLSSAEKTLIRLVNLRPQQSLELGVEDGLAGEKSRFLLGLLYQELGRWNEAELQFRTAIRHNPRSSQAWVGLGQLYLKANYWEGLDHALAELRQCPLGDLLAGVLESRWLIAQGKLAPARRLLEGIIARNPEMLWPRLVLSDLSAHGGMDRQEAIELHRTILQIDPQVAIARRRLELLLRESGAAQGLAESPAGQPGCEATFTDR